MKKVQPFMSQKLQPLAVKIAANKVLIAIRDGVHLGMPLLYIGSFLLIVQKFPLSSWLTWLTQTGIASYLTQGIAASFGIMGFVACFGIAQSYAVQWKRDGIFAGLLALSSYIILTPSLLAVSPHSLTPLALSNLGSSGFLIALFVGLISSILFCLIFAHPLAIRLPKTLPKAVPNGLRFLFPGVFIVLFWLAVAALIQHFQLSNRAIHPFLFTLLNAPLHFLGNSLLGTLLIVCCNSACWFLGLNGRNLLNSLLLPLWLMNADANRLVYQEHAHETLPHLVTPAFIDHFVFIGGGGATLGLVLVLALLTLRPATSELTKTLSSLSFVPSLFNSNETVLFGLPVVLNLSLAVPFFLAPLVNALISYTAMASGLVQQTIGAVLPLSTPPLLSGFFATGGHLSGALLQALCLLLDALLYWPFYARLHKQQQREEALANAA